MSKLTPTEIAEFMARFRDDLAALTLQEAEEKIRAAFPKDYADEAIAEMRKTVCESLGEKATQEAIDAIAKEASQE